MLDYDRLYDPIPDLDAYLKRIDYKGPKEASLETLAQVMMQHLLHVPFENLSVFHESKVPDITTQAIFQKIVEENRGGYCFEQNGLYVEALKALGFDAYCVPVRIHMNDPRKPISHRGIVVNLEGRQIYTDVGFGGPAPVTPLEMDKGDIWQKSGNREYQVVKDGDKVVINFREVSVNESGEKEYGPLMWLFSFINQPTEPYDFLPSNLYTSAVPEAPFRMRHCISMLQEDGHISIDGKTFTIKKNGQVSQRELTSCQDLASVLKEYFGISYEHLTDRFLSL